MDCFDSRWTTSLALQNRRERCSVCLSVRNESWGVHLVAIQFHCRCRNRKFVTCNSDIFSQTRSEWIVSLLSQTKCCFVFILASSCRCHVARPCLSHDAQRRCPRGDGTWNEMYRCKISSRPTDGWPLDQQRLTESSKQCIHKTWNCFMICSRLSPAALQAGSGVLFLVGHSIFHTFCSVLVFVQDILQVSEHKVFYSRSS